MLFGGWKTLREHFYLNNGDGTFSRWTGQPARFEDEHPNNGATEAWGDFDNDGFLDLFVANINSGVDFLYSNNGNANRWLEVKLLGTASNRLAVGAKIFTTATVRGQVMRQLRVISANNEQTLVAHFGLGDTTQVDTLRIEWPSGIVQEIPNVAPNQILTVTEPPRLIPQAAGGFRIQSWINQIFDVQASTDLADWTTVSTVTNLTGTLTFQDPEPGQHACRYHRVLAR